MFQLRRSSVALRFDGPAFLVKAHQRERIPVEILEVGEHSAPDRCVLSVQQRVVKRNRCLGLPLVRDLLQAWRIEKLDSALSPFAKLGYDIIRNKHYLRRPADEPVLFGVGFGCNQRKYGAAVRGRNRHPALTGSKADIAHQTKSHLVYVESQALVLIANEDVNRVNAKMRPLSVQRKAGLVRVKACGRAVHRRDYSDISFIAGHSAATSDWYYQPAHPHSTRSSCVCRQILYHRMP